jgi:hypothetical protein
MTLTRISAVTGLLVAAVQGAVLFGWDITQEQQAWISGFIVLAGGVIHTLLNPDVGPTLGGDDA